MHVSLAVVSESPARGRGAESTADPATNRSAASADVMAAPVDGGGDRRYDDSRSVSNKDATLANRRATFAGSTAVSGASDPHVRPAAIRGNDDEITAGAKGKNAGNFPAAISLNCCPKSTIFYSRGWLWSFARVARGEKGRTAIFWYINSTFDTIIKLIGERKT